MKRNTVFLISITTVGIIISMAFFGQHYFDLISTLLLDIIVKNFSWIYLLGMLIFVVLSLGIAFSKYGSVKLGKVDDKPEYNTLSWFAMLFCAGMGVGLVFWGVSEPLTHYINPYGVEGQSADSAAFAIRSSFMHWGVHAWSAYAIVGLGIAYFSYKKGLPALISSGLMPFFGADIAKKKIGVLVDSLAVFATIAGIVTSLGLGVIQISSGLYRVFGLPNTQFTQVLIVIVVAVIFIGSSVSGLDKGIKFLSNGTLVISIFLMMIIFLFGPKVDILNNLVLGIGDYIQRFIGDSLFLMPYGDNLWVENWRIFYWAWWIAWAPFTGLFIARISKGRTIREFILGVVLIPTLFSLLWFSIMGSTAISMAHNRILSENEMAMIVSVPEVGLFVVLDHLPFGRLISIIAVVLLLLFFVTSADSGTYVLGTMTSNGEANPTIIRKIIWGITESLLAISLLLIGGLKSLQTLSIVAAFPFLFVMLAITIGVIKDLRKNMDKEG